MFLEHSQGRADIRRSVNLPVVPGVMRQQVPDHLQERQIVIDEQNLFVLLRHPLRQLPERPGPGARAGTSLADGVVADARIVLGAVGPTPIRARAAEAALAGAKPSRERLAQAAALVRDEVDPLDDLRGSAEYKREMARVWTERALLALVEA